MNKQEQETRTKQRKNNKKEKRKQSEIMNKVDEKMTSQRKV